MSGKILLAATDPILSCEESMSWERNLLKSEADEWLAMNRVGESLGRAIMYEHGLSKFSRSRLSVLVLVGKGHNGGDALLALDSMHQAGNIERATLVFSTSLDDLRRNTSKALEHLRSEFPAGKLEEISPLGKASSRFFDRVKNKLHSRRFDVIVDGLLGMQFKPPLREVESKLIEFANLSVEAALRVAVDVPSGVGDAVDENAFRADVTFATGICKKGLLAASAAAFCGSIRYLDIGFFCNDPLDAQRNRLVKDSVLDGLRRRRPSTSEKRQFGHLLIVSGSAQMPGALAMCVESALQSGVGLVTVCGPESRISELSVGLPEAMWVACPETPEGGLALEGLYLIRRYMDRATAMLVGPGLGREAETFDLVKELIRLWEGPLVLDADALQKGTIDVLRDRKPERAILTPHLGEFKRIAKLESMANSQEWADELGGALVVKGSNTRICSRGNCYLNTSGNAVLSRGGSGDILSGIMGGLLAKGDWTPEEVAVMSVYWHGKAADLLAYEKGQTAVRTTQVIDCLSDALSEEEVWARI